MFNSGETKRRTRYICPMHVSEIYFFLISATRKLIHVENKYLYNLNVSKVIAGH